MSSLDLITPGDVAELLGISQQTLAVWRCNGRYDLPYVKVGRYVRYRRDDVSAFVQRRCIGAGGKSDG
ncbi:helix-turn-helix domain-containing protein [Chromatocurvus halotolerans]|uniref:Excisionase family DNA binding protein n=1 Tax=Chromatocurvus halotolerans TaxID=1132028 RepID=A0A4R2KRT9_9GAMM|nr:helix-turn-helix domain-containing protein [Chromatocurvus halotolerans]TCO73706.1 excisionase family DNA binding protein [Chromatocurvus halotolerans]